MAQLYFRYGAMNSGKTIEILKVAHNYEEQGKHVMIMTSALDTREKKDTITSRIEGLSRKAVSIAPDSDVFHMVETRIQRDGKISCVLVDEAQFLEKHHVLELTKVVDQLKVPVMTFGLKNDFQNHLFEGSENLLLYADKIEEMKTICWFCEKKATMNLRIDDGKPVYTGAQIQPGGNEAYFPVCRKHYNHPPKDLTQNEE